MFTGLSFGLGVIKSTALQGGDGRLCIQSKQPVHDWKVGESIAVNGACLSVESFNDTSFTVYASGETLQRTTLKSLQTGSLVNLERALQVNERFGGHIVTGHVDGIAQVNKVEPRGASLLLGISFPKEFAPFILAKGSVCLDGISLTINNCCSSSLEVNIIPETQKTSTISTWKVGKHVNFETDVLAKYVRHQLSFLTGNSHTEAEAELVSHERTQGISIDFLKKHGF